MFSYGIVAPGRDDVNIFLRIFCIFYPPHGTLRAYTVKKEVLNMAKNNQNKNQNQNQNQNQNKNGKNENQEQNKQAKECN